MAPLIFLLATTIGTHLFGRLFAPQLRPWPITVRTGVVVMFIVTGTAHFIGLRAELIAMVPPALPAPGFLVTITGVLELAGALGLLFTQTRPWAAGGLSLMLIAMFPANIHLALTGTNLPWDDTLVPRTLLQLIFLMATSAVFLWDRQDRQGRRDSRPNGLRAASSRDR